MESRENGAEVSPEGKPWWVCRKHSGRTEGVSMVAQTSWASASTVNHSASFETEDTMSAKVTLDNYAFRGSGLPTIIGTSAPLRTVLAMVRVWSPPPATLWLTGETD